MPDDGYTSPLKGALESLDHAISLLEAGLKGPESGKGSAAAESLGTPSSEYKEETIKTKQAKREQKKLEKEEKKLEKGKKKEQKLAVALASEQDQTTSNFLRCNLRVGRVKNVGPHEEADGLYVLKVSYGKKTDSDELEVRTVCAGLRKFVSQEELENKLVVTITNLKPRKLKGVMSEAMILAGSIASDEGGKEVVKPIIPPDDAKEGLVVGIGKGEDRELNPKNVSSKIWDKVVALFSVIDGKACYDKTPMTVSGSAVTCDLPDGSEIH